MRTSPEPGVAAMASQGKQPGILPRISNAIVETLENLFYRLGKLIARYPVVFIICTIAIVIPFVVGILLYFEEENRLEKLWVPYDSRAYVDKRWTDEQFPNMTRRESVIIEADDVLTPEVLQEMLLLDQKLKTMVKPIYTWEEICARVAGECWSNSLLELWKFNETAINALTRDDILDMVNSVEQSPMYFNYYNITLRLGDTTKDVDGRIIGAKATDMIYTLKTTATSNSVGSDDRSDIWEEDFIEVMGEADKNAKNGDSSFSRVYYYAVTSFDRVSNKSIVGDVSMLIIGYVLIGVYVGFVLGKMNLVEMRVPLSMAGLLSVGLAVGVSYGLFSYAGVIYGPLHSVLPFLLLGIGVDDMFVIVQSMDTLPKHIRTSNDIPEIVGMAMREAGVAITVTSLTDMLAFGIGATSVIPALRSFCAYAAVGIVMTFIFQSTLFVACMAIDVKRQQQSRNGYCCWYVHKDYKPPACSQKTPMQSFFDKIYGPLVVKLPFKIVFMVITFVMLAGGIYGVTQLKQDFDFTWFLPKHTYAYKYFDVEEDYFPYDGLPTAVYFSENIDYFEEFDELEKVHQYIAEDEFTSPGTVQSWYMSYREWMNDTGVDFPGNEDDFYSLLQTYINGAGGRFTKDIQFKADNRIAACQVNLVNTAVTSASEEIDCMESLRRATAKGPWPQQDCFPYTWFYINYETNKIIQEELYRNIGLAFVCIILMVLVLIANLWTCLLVSASVIMAVIDVAGVMYYWGLTIDTVTAVNLILALGFAIDYSAHVGRTFMTTTGERNERVKKTLHHIGPAVMHGGISTFIAFILLAGSESYVFRTFFKVFFSVVIFGLYHGLVFLPILLSWVGPDPYLCAHDRAGEEAALENGEAGGSSKPSGLPPPQVTPHDNLAYKPDDSVSDLQQPDTDHRNVIAVNPEPPEQTRF